MMLYDEKAQVVLGLMEIKGPTYFEMYGGPVCFYGQCRERKDLYVMYCSASNVFVCVCKEHVAEAKERYDYKEFE